MDKQLAKLLPLFVVSLLVPLLVIATLYFGNELYNSGQWDNWEWWKAIGAVAGGGMAFFGLMSLILLYSLHSIASRYTEPVVKLESEVIPSFADPQDLKGNADKILPSFALKLNALTLSLIHI